MTEKTYTHGVAKTIMSDDRQQPMYQHEGEKGSIISVGREYYTNPDKFRKEKKKGGKRATSRQRENAEINRDERVEKSMNE